MMARGVEHFSGLGNCCSSSPQAGGGVTPRTRAGGDGGNRPGPEQSVSY